MAFTVQQHFTNLDSFEDKECVEVLDKHSGLKFLLLNLEMVSVFVSYCPLQLQSILIYVSVQTSQQKLQKIYNMKTKERQQVCQLCNKGMWGI